MRTRNQLPKVAVRPCSGNKQRLHIKVPAAHTGIPLTCLLVLALLIPRGDRYLQGSNEVFKSLETPGFLVKNNSRRDPVNGPRLAQRFFDNNVNKGQSPADTYKIYSASIGESAKRAFEKPPTWEWPVATPEQQGLDSVKLAELTNLIRAGERFPRLHALLIVRHGCLVIEAYFNKWQADRLHTLQSVSKSFTSALVGMAIAKGEFKGVDEKILDFFPEVKDIANMDERKASIRLKDLLTMRSGTDYHERGPDSPHFQLNRLARGWDKFYLDRPMLRPPGTEFSYDSGGVILLSSMLKNRTGKHADEYAQRFLFTPLGIEKTFWFKNEEGHPHTGGGLCLTARDAAKFGLLYLQNGRWEDEQIMPEEWVHESFRKHVDLTVEGQPPSGYGYLWWILAPDPQGNGQQDIYAARGRGGQFIFIIPEHAMVVVVLGDTQTGTDQNRPIEFLYSHILPAVRH